MRTYLLFASTLFGVLLGCVLGMSLYTYQHGTPGACSLPFRGPGEGRTCADVPSRDPYLAGGIAVGVVLCDVGLWRVLRLD